MSLGGDILGVSPSDALVTKSSIVQDIFKDASQSSKCFTPERNEFEPLGILSLFVALPGLALLFQLSLSWRGPSQGTAASTSSWGTAAGALPEQQGGEPQVSTRETLAAWRGAARDKTSNCT